MLTLDAATTIAQAALTFAAEHRLAPLTVVILDPGGHPILLHRQDRSAFLRVEIATAKAYGALGLGFSSRGIAGAANRLPEFFGALATASGGRLIPAAGGVLIINSGEIIGAVGASGDSSDADEAAVITGVHAAGFTSDPAEPVA